MKKIRILAIPGSVRKGSSNHKVLTIVGDCMPPQVDYMIFEGLASLAHFDGSDTAPVEVADFLNQVRSADGIVICTPEYAFGVPGTLKNALDWSVGSGEFSGKPLVYITASTGGEHAHESLGKTLTAIDCRIPEGGTLLMPSIRAKLNAEGTFKDPKHKEEVEAIINVLLNAIEK